MQHCAVCKGRTIMVGEDYKCMNSQCSGSQLQAPPEGIICRCGEKMSYQGEDSWGQPNYHCIHCGAIKRM